LNFVELSASRVLNFIYSVSVKPLPRLGMYGRDHPEFETEVFLRYHRHVAYCFFPDWMGWQEASGRFWPAMIHIGRDPYLSVTMWL
jgi:hypothetical protein